ncbi:MAG: tyrosine-type recombinase/integrase, partial [Methylocystis sp.]
MAAAIEDFLGERARRNDSPHTLRNYGADLKEFLEYFSPPGTEPPAPSAIDLLSLREWLGHLYERDQKPATIRRKLASLRALYKFLRREHRVERDPARLLRLPRMPKTLPEVPNTEVTNALVDGTGRAELERPHPARDRVLLELLYGCGLRISEAVGLDLEDFDRSERWVRVRGKGRKERQVPYGAKAGEALETYLEERLAENLSEKQPHALFLNHRGQRLTDRGARG